jgi:flavodoxin
LVKAMVIYDTVFGNTEKIAQAMGQALEALGQVDVRRVGDVPASQVIGLDLLLVGSPTRGFRPTPATTAWLKSLAAGSLGGIRVGAFDTRIPMAKAPGFLRVMVRIFGYAAEPIANLLTAAGGTLAAAPEGFMVLASEGPLQDGELERAAKWAEGMATNA